MNDKIELDIGVRLKGLRKEKGLSIKELSKNSGVSTGVISEIERDKVVPTVVTLYKISITLQVHISYFFNDITTVPNAIVKKGTHRKIIMNNKLGVYEMLSTGEQNTMFDLVKVTISPGKIKEETKDKDIAHQGEECGYVLKGILNVLIDDEEYVLHEGDSITFSSNRHHRYINRGKKECISIWAMTPKFF